MDTVAIKADEIRHKLLTIWSADSQHEGMEVKVKFMSSRNQYVVKTRKPVEIAKKEKKKSGKGKRRNQKNSSRGESDTSSVV